MKLKLSIIILTTLLLQACLYPDSQKVENAPTNDEQLNEVQQAVNQYKDQNGGLLPIKNRGQQTPIFIKYPIDFTKLSDANILGQPPGNSYERGGPYSYVILDPENEVEVKVADVRVNQKLRSINYEINIYRNENLYPPYGEMINKGYFNINLEAIELDEVPTVKSPYSGQKLEIIINHEGKPLVDYRPDVYRILEKENINEYDGDLRYLLTDHYPIVPSYSPPMSLVDGEIIFKEHVSQTTE
ncbi:hypothetical protein E3U55_03870 [Filobacillus milosensis]|uniref:Uncharacterized protein n=1 Tax=Filobacillus milosensis TaxID=94137 RepID=A0A4Y8ISQ7_9BACI|nr:hypothetical protein [Filobacillus milosensis]TFB23960.1 hypothetical protein E3U55_03870 [Filobacillus milosensis]